MAAGLILGTLVVLTSSCFPLAWLGLELNLMAFLPSALPRESQKKGAMGYFIAQSLGSLLLLLSGLALSTLSPFALLLAAGLLVKMGLLPLHYWVPAVVEGMSAGWLYLLLSWQKIAPLSLLWMSVVYQLPWALGNAVGGALLMLGASSIPLLLVFSGMVQMGWLMSLAGGFAYHYLGLYFVVLALTVAWSRTPGFGLGWAFMNAGGLPPLTGFVIKVKALLRLPTRLGGCLLSASGLALCSYSRMLVNGRMHTASFSPSLVGGSCLGLV